MGKHLYFKYKIIVNERQKLCSLRAMLQIQLLPDKNRAIVLASGLCVTAAVNKLPIIASDDRWKHKCISYLALTTGNCVVIVLFYAAVSQLLLNTVSHSKLMMSREPLISVSSLKENKESEFV